MADINLPSPELLVAPSGDDETIEFAKNKTNTGDGYVRLARKGINNIRHNHSLTYIPLTDAQADAITDQIESTGGVDTITWTPTGESSPRYFYCDNISVRRVTPLHKQISFTLVEKFI